MIDFSAMIRNQVLNWTSDYRNFMRLNFDDYFNLENDAYWRAKMTDSEKEGRSHPNRRYDYIPYRLENIRDGLRYKLLDVIVGRNNYVKDSSWSENDCKRCGVSYEKQHQIMKEMTACLESKGESAFLSELLEEDYEITRDECWDKVTDGKSAAELSGLKMTRWTHGGVPFGGPARRYGFCSKCYDESIKPAMDKMITQL
jgi:hypothetical protein